ncbi:BEN domain-containing protein 2 isoform X1 [Electrophorus electricus]|nr:BEN domain-containing protein 2 isoform X1 [Electrophorus electricus]
MSLHRPRQLCTILDNFDTKTERRACGDMAGETGASRGMQEMYGNQAAAEHGARVSPDNGPAPEIEDDTFLDVTCVQMEQESPDCVSGEENAASPESFGADPLRTLGEILAYCQVMYGAIQKLDAKFELLKTSVTTLQQVDPPAPTRGPPPSHRGLVPVPNTPGSTPSLQMKVEVVRAPPHTHRPQQGTPDPSDGRRSPSDLAVPDDLVLAQAHTQHQAPPHSGREMLTQHWLNSTDGRRQAYSNTMEHVGSGGCQPSVWPGPACAVTETPSQQRWDPLDQSPPPHTATGNAGNRKFVVPSSFLRKAGTMAQPTSAARFLMRCVFSRQELLHGNTRGDPSRGLRRLDPERLNAIREWAQRRYPKHELNERGKDWRACLAVMNKATRYIRLMDRTRRLNTVTDMNECTAPIQVFEPESTRAITDEEPKPTAEIDVELSDSDTDHPRRKRAPKSMPRGESDKHRVSDNRDASSQEPLVFLGSAGRGVKVPQAALFGAWQRPRPSLVARYLIRFMFSEDVLVQSNVYGNAEHGIQPLDHNKISALREHLCERFHWLQLQEDGQDWKACVDAINSCIRKTRHKRKKSRR